MKKMLIFTILAVLILVLSACEGGDVDDNDGNRNDLTLEEQQLECSRVNGEWTEFSNTCVDSCELARSEEPIMCGQAFTDGCDCGPSKCWDFNQGTCVKN